MPELPSNLTMTMIRDAGFCVSGLRSWCEEHDVDIRRMVRGQVTFEELEHIEDANLDVLRQMRVEMGVE